MMAVNMSREWFLISAAAQPIVTVVYPESTACMATIFCLLFIVVGIFGNLVTILALVRSPKLLHNATTIFVINLCVAYLLFCTICLPLTAARFIHQEWVFGVTACVLYPFFFYGNFAASLMSMVAITINRYILIVHNQVYEKLYKNWCILLWLGWVWLFSFGMVLPPLSGWWGEYGYNNKTFSCTIKDRDGSSPKKFLFIFGFAMPCVIILICYTIIFLYVRNSKRRSSINNGQRRERRTKEEMKLTRMMLIIFCTFLLCLLPLTICNVVLKEEQVPTLQVVASICAWFSSVINPFIYAVMNRTYRKAYQALMPKKLRQMWLCPDCAFTRNRNNSPPTLVVEGNTNSHDCTVSMALNGRALHDFYFNNDSGLGCSRTPSPRPKRGSPLATTSNCNGKVSQPTERNTLLSKLNNMAYLNGNNNESRCKEEGQQRKLLDNRHLNPSQIRVRVNRLDLPVTSEENIQDIKETTPCKSDNSKRDINCEENETELDDKCDSQVAAAGKDDDTPREFRQVDDDHICVRDSRSDFWSAENEPCSSRNRTWTNDSNIPLVCLEAAINLENLKETDIL